MGTIANEPDSPNGTRPYVDLNQVRAGIAEVPEDSQYTSVYERVQAEKASRKEKARANIRKRQGSRSRLKVTACGGQATYVRGDDWLTPVTFDEHSHLTAAIH